MAPPKPIERTKVNELKNHHVEWVALMPYSFVKSENGELIYSETIDTTKKWHWWGERAEGIATCVKFAHNENIKVMLKPHLWLGWGAFTGDIAFKDEAAWQRFEQGYKSYILFYAKMADSLNVELFCIGTELKNHVAKRPDFWFELIKDIKKVYKGKLTYAENWDAYTEVPFWNELDFIGVDGYFPLSNKQHPTKAELEIGWQKHLEKMKEVASKHQKPILFTEIGYRSCDFSTDKPWESNFDLPYNEQIQADALLVFIEQNWQQPWFAGAFIWKWFPDINERNARDLFTPQNKLAEKVITSHFKNL